MPSPPGALFYAAPNGETDGGMGFGMGAKECSGQVLVDVNQNLLLYGRTSVATCIRESDGLGVELEAQEPIVMRSPTYATHYGPVVESAGTNFFKSSYDLNDPDGGTAWVNIATVTANVWPGPFSHYRTNSGFEQLSDVSGAASQCSTQTVTDTTAGNKAVSCTFRSGTLTSARIIIAGAGNSAGDRTCTFTGLDTALSRDDRRGCVTPAYTGSVTSVAVSICPGSNDAAQGTIGAVDCQYEKNDHVTTYIPTTTGTVNRLIASLTFPTLPATQSASDTKGCMGSELYTFKYDAESFWSLITFQSSGARGPFYFPDTTAKAFDSTNTATLSIASLFNSTVQASSMWAADGGLSIWVQDAGIGTTTYDGTMFGSSISTTAGRIETESGSQDGLVSNLILDTEDNLCRAQAKMVNVTRVAAIGDSLFARTDIPQNVPTGFFQRASVNGTNFAVGGQTFVGGGSGCKAQWLTAGGTYNTILVMCGVNDITINDTSGAALYALEQPWVSEWAYRGVQVYWLDILPFKGYDSTPSRLTARTDFNALRATYCASPPANVHCVTNSSLVWDPADHEALLPANTLDGLHLSQAGANFLITNITANYP